MGWEVQGGMKHWRVRNLRGRCLAPAGHSVPRSPCLPPTRTAASARLPLRGKGAEELYHHLPRRGSCESLSLVLARALARATRGSEVQGLGFRV